MKAFMYFSMIFALIIDKWECSKLMNCKHQLLKFKRPLLLLISKMNDQR